MNGLIKINNKDLHVKEFQSQRVITFQDIDTVHERPEGTAKRNFSINRNRFVENVDYFLIKPSDIEKYEIRTLEIPNRGQVLITESGYLMLAKSLTDDLAWEVQRQLVNTYFRAKKLSNQEMMRIQLGMIDDHEERINHLENTMTIDYGQQQVLKKKVNVTVVEWLGGKKSKAYKEMSRKAFSECNRDIQDYFNVNSRNNIPKLNFDDAIDYIEGWQPSTNTKMMISYYNTQMAM